LSLLFSNKHVDDLVERALAENVSVREFDRNVTERRSVFLQMLLVLTSLGAIVSVTLTDWFDKLLLPTIALGMCFGLQLSLIVLMKFGWLSSRFVRIMCAVNACVAVFVSASVSGAPFVFVCHTGTVPFLTVMMAAIVSVNYAWIFFAVMLGFSFILPKDIFGFGNAMFDMKFLLKATSFMPVITGGICLVLISHVVMDSARGRKMSEKVFERISRQKDTLAANLSHEVSLGPFYLSFPNLHSLFVWVDSNSSSRSSRERRNVEIRQAFVERSVRECGRDLALLLRAAPAH
jgi:hypothetical protein